MSLWLAALRDGGILQGFEVDNDVATVYAPGIPGEYYKVLGFSAEYTGTAPSAGFKSITFKRGTEVVLVIRRDFAGAGNIEGFSLPAALHSRTGESFTVELEAGGAAGCLGQVSIFASPQPGFSPLQLTDLSLWWDTTGLPDLPVGQVDDLSGNSNHLVNTSSPVMADYQGLRGIYYDGSSDFGISASAGPNGVPRAIFAVVGIIDSDGFMGMGRNVAQAGTWGLHRTQFIGHDNSVVAWVRSHNITSSNVRLYVLLMESTQIISRVNGVQQGAAVAQVATTNSDFVRVGHDGGGRPLSEGYFFEAFMCEGELSSDVIQSAETYLLSKWRLK